VQEIKVTKWSDWEELCCYILPYVLFKEFNFETTFRRYGGTGQKQYGIDLIPDVPNVSVVGQCKVSEVPLRWETVLMELKKTDGYPNPIRHFFLLTTGRKHTSVQDIQNRGMYMHSRADGTTFQVHVIYWDDIDNLDFVPTEVTSRIFPGAHRISKTHSREVRFNSSFIESIAKFKNYISRVINISNIEWLETWNFSCGYVEERDFDPFNELYFEHDRVSVAVSKGLYDWLYQNGRTELAEALPGGERFFRALKEFRNSVTDQIIGDDSRLSILDFPAPSRSKITATWQSSAKYLAQVYREDVMGLPRL
jgi:hypothetical protein